MTSARGAFCNACGVHIPNGLFCGKHSGESTSILEARNLPIEMLRAKGISRIQHKHYDERTGRLLNEVDITLDTTEIKFSCAFCVQEFNTPQALQEHRETKDQYCEVDNVCFVKVCAKCVGRPDWAQQQRELSRFYMDKKDWTPEGV